MSNYTLEGIKISPEEFLGAFFEAADKVCIRVFSDKPGSAFQGGVNLSVAQGHFDSILDTLHKHNIEDRGIFFVITYGGHTDAEIKRINAQYMESDGLSLEDQLAKIQAFPLEPSLIVKTQKSLHTYWLIKDGNVKKFRRIQRGLISHFDADPKCENKSRVFRLPGFNHCKEEPVLVEYIKYNPELRYTQAQLEAALPDMPEEKETTSGATSTDRGSQLGIKTVGLRCHFIKYCNKNAKTLPKPYPKYSHEQTEKKILHFYNSTLKGFCLFIGISRSKFYATYEKDEVFRDTITRARNVN